MSKVIVGTGVLNQLEQVIANRKHVLVVDEVLSPYFQQDHLPYSASEQSKNLESIEKLASLLQEREIDRHSLILAAGGGNTLDVVGFLASTYMRGLPWIAIPTSLLAMVDSAIGGKTAVNNAGTKNLLGSFHLPESVLIDLTFINSLSKEEFRNGMAEVIKIALIRDLDFVCFLEEQNLKIQKCEPDVLKTMIEWAVRLKTQIVEEDYKEANKRKLLNYGHTFGHAIERASQFNIPHGQAVSMGMVLMNEYCGLERAKQERIKTLLHLYGLPTQLPQELNANRLRQEAGKDKKRVGNEIDIVQLSQLGSAEVIRDSNFLL